MKRLYHLSILLIAFILPSAFYGFTFVALAVTFICWLYARDYKNISQSIRRPQVFLPVSIYFLLAAGMLYTEHPGKTLSGLSMQISFVLFPLIIGTSSIINKQLIKLSGRVFAFSICLFLLIAIGYALYDTNETGVGTIMVSESLYSKFRSFGLTSVYRNWHPTNVAMFANLAIAFLLQECLDAWNKKRILLPILLILFLGICLLLLNSMIGIASFLLVLVLYLYKIARKLNLSTKLIASVFVAICAGIVSLYYFNPFQNEKINSLKYRSFKITDDQNERNLLTMRLAKWETHLDIFKSNWLAGDTYGDINYTRKQTYEAKGYQDLAHYNYNAHNQYIEVLATYGITGGFLFFGMLLFPLISKGKNPYLLPFLLIACVTFLTESLLVRQQGILFFMFFYVLLTHQKSTTDVSPVYTAKQV